MSTRSNPDIELPWRLPCSRIRAGTRFMRIHRRDRNAIWFGPSPGNPPVSRFDDPLREFRVCYFGNTLEVCFAETFLRNPPVRILALDDLAAGSVATVELRRDLRVVSLHGPGLARLGTTAKPATGEDYNLSRFWSRVLWQHTDKPDGIAYRSRHDDSALCVAIYDRASDSLAQIREDALTESPKILARLLKRYDLALTR